MNAYIHLHTYALLVAKGWRLDINESNCLYIYSLKDLETNPSPLLSADLIVLAPNLFTLFIRLISCLYTLADLLIALHLLLILIAMKQCRSNVDTQSMKQYIYDQIYCVIFIGFQVEASIAQTYT